VTDKVNDVTIGRAPWKTEAGMFMFHISYTDVWFISKEKDIEASYKSYLAKCYGTNQQ